MSGVEVSWPAFIKHAGHSELTFVADRARWDRIAELPEYACEHGDILVDSNGNGFEIGGIGNRTMKLRQREQGLSHPEILELVREHLSVSGECCVAKINPGSIPGCMLLLSCQQDA